ncbi:sulfatase family protein [Sphingomonas gilva]|nr:sulfatase-like hydrolase/transferase [Sphingomonas gilva]
MGTALVALAPVPAHAQSSPATPAQPRQAPRPNILFVLVDDMGFGDLSVMGNRKVATPNIDRLARRGLLMTRFYDAAPICSPSRAGFFTGRFPAELGFVNYVSGRAFNAAHGQADWLDPAVPNVARMLKATGYATGHFGKWHLGGGRDIGDAPWPTAYGFDESYTTFEGLGPRVLVSDHENDLSRQSELLGQGPTTWEVKRRLTGLYCDKTLDFVARNRDRPWFVQLWLNDVHDPWAPDGADAEAARAKAADPDDARYLGALRGMDRDLGRLFDRLEAMGEADDTLIVLTSDNGPASLPRYYKDGRTAPGSVQRLRGRKWSNYEGGIRQPLIMAWPKHIRAGLRDDRSVGHGVDLLPTLAAVAGVQVPAGADGVDLSPVMAGKPMASRPALFWAYGKAGRKRPPQPALPHDRAPLYAMRTGKWKLLANPNHTDIQLYDLDADPNETTDLAACRPKVRARLMAQLDGWIGTLPQ